MTSLLLDLLYLSAAVLLGPPYLLLRLLRGRRTVAPWRRLGGAPVLPPAGAGVIWLHAVSVGEALAIRGLVAGLRESRPKARLVVTCTTATGLDVARKEWPDLTVLPSPFDLGWAVRRFLRHVRPELLLLVEVELWPNLLGILRRRQIPVVVVNARLSERSARGYRRLARVLPRFLGGVTAFCAQDATQAGRIEALGIARDRIHVTGNLKFDNLRMREPGPERTRLRGELGWPQDGPVLVAGSTHPGEEELLLDTLDLVRRQRPGMRLVLVPRHPGRSQRIAETLSRRGLPHSLRSGGRGAAEAAVLLVDTLGELSILYALADVAFVGATLVPIGGHNLLEPAALGLPILVGPHLFKVRESADALAREGCLKVASDAPGLAAAALEFLQDERILEQAAAGARRVIDIYRGSVSRTLSAMAATTNAQITKDRRHA